MRISSLRTTLGARACSWPLPRPDPHLGSRSRGYVQHANRLFLPDKHAVRLKLQARYGLRASRDNPGVSHENGLIKAWQGSLAHALNQALRLRGMSKFLNLEGHGHFVAETVVLLHVRCATNNLVHVTLANEIHAGALCAVVQTAPYGSAMLVDGF